MCNLINTHTKVSLIPLWEVRCERHRITRMAGPDCAVMCNLVNTHKHVHRYGSWTDLAAEEDPKGRGIGTLLGKAGAGV